MLINKKTKCKNIYDTRPLIHLGSGIRLWKNHRERPREEPQGAPGMLDGGAWVAQSMCGAESHTPHLPVESIRLWHHRQGNLCGVKPGALQGLFEQWAHPNFLCVSREFVISSILSRHSKNLKPLDGPVLQLSFIQKVKKNTSSRREGMRPKRQDENRGPSLAPLFICFFLLPLSLPCINWASQKRRLFYLRCSLWSSDLPLFYFHGLFLSLSFCHHHFGLLFPILTT